MNNEDIRKQIERLRNVTCDTVDESKTLELLLAVKVAVEPFYTGPSKDNESIMLALDEAIQAIDNA